MSALPSAAINPRPASYYLPNPTPDHNILSPEESFHCIKVNRKRLGDLIEILDGRGGVHQARITADSPSSCQFEIIGSRIQPSPKYGIELAVSPTKNLDRIEWLIEKTVELGIDTIVFIGCEYSERRRLKTKRLKKKAVVALKQSGNPFLPAVQDLVDFGSFISSVGTEPQKFIAHPGADNPDLFQAAHPGQSYSIVIGPEGGFSHDELENAGLAGFQKVSLGDWILRTETAGVVACHTLHLVNL